jgi:hypothetical protein
MSSVSRFADVFIPLILVMYGLLLVVYPDRYLPQFSPIVGSLMGFALAAMGAYLYSRRVDAD